MKRQFYQGWYVVLGAFVSYTFASMASNFGLFVVPVSKDLHLSRADTNNWIIVSSLVSAMTAPFVGKLIDCVSVRLLMGLGGIVLALSFAGIASTTSVVVMLLLAVPLAFASDVSGGMAAGAMAARWFRRRRGRALVLVGIGGTASSFFLSPLIAVLMASYGWRTALMTMGGIAGIVIVLVAIFLVRSRPDPEQISLWEAYDNDAIATDTTVETRNWTFGALLRERNFYFMVGGIGLLFASDRAILFSVAPYLSDAGVDLAMAGIFISVLTGSAVAGKLMVGFWSDYADHRKIFLVVAVLHLLLLGTFLVQPSYWIMFAIAATMGMGIGGVLPVNQIIVARMFGSASFGTVAGSIAVVYSGLTMAAVRFVGVVHDRTGSYDLAFVTFAGLVVLGAILVWQIRLDKKAA